MVLFRRSMIAGHLRGRGAKRRVAVLPDGCAVEIISLTGYSALRGSTGVQPGYGSGWGRLRFQKSRGRILTRSPADFAGSFGGRTMRVSAWDRGARRELSWERTGVTASVPSGRAAETARM